MSKPETDLQRESRRLYKSTKKDEVPDPYKALRQAKRERERDPQDTDNGLGLTAQVFFYGEDLPEDEEEILSHEEIDDPAQGRDISGKKSRRRNDKKPPKTTKFY